MLKAPSPSHGLEAVGRADEQPELIGGARDTFADDHLCVDPGAVMASFPEQIERDFTTIYFRPSQPTGDPCGVAALCRDHIRMSST